MHSKLNLSTPLQGWTGNPPLNVPQTKHKNNKRGSRVINTESTVGDRILTVHSWENLPRDNGSHFHIKLYLSRWKMLKQNTGFLLAIFMPHSLPKLFQTRWVPLKSFPPHGALKEPSDKESGWWERAGTTTLPRDFRK